MWKLRNPVIRKRFEEILDPLNPKEDEGGDVNEAHVNVNTGWLAESNRRDMWMDQRSCKTHSKMVVE